VVVLVDDLVVEDVALILENSRNLGLQLRSRHVDLLEACLQRIPDAGEHVSDGVGNHDRSSFALPFFTSCQQYPYQLDFVTPGSSPSKASCRKQMRHSLNFRM